MTERFLCFKITNNKADFKCDKNHIIPVRHYLPCIYINEKTKVMKKNMGLADKIIRIILAIVIAVLFFMDIISGTLGIVLIALAAIFVLTSFISFCPLYLPFGVKTCKKD